MFRRLYTHRFFRHHGFYDREVYENILHDPKSEIGKKLNMFIQICVLFAVGSIILETVRDWWEIYALQFFIIDVFVSFVFVTEYIYRFLRAKSKSFFLTKAMNIIDFLSFWPFFLGLLFAPFAGFDILKILRMFRTLRLFEVSSQSPIALGFMRTVKQYRQEYKWIIWIFGTFLVIFSTFVYWFENGVNPAFASIPHALWWGIVTMTTVGYWDMAPITLWGKILWTFLIFLGPVLLAVISSITILVFMDVAESQKLSLFKTCSKCRTRNNDEANFCLNCGHEHFISNIVEDAPRKKLAFMERLFSKK